MAKRNQKITQAMMNVLVKHTDGYEETLSMFNRVVEKLNVLQSIFANATVEKDGETTLETIERFNNACTVLQALLTEPVINQNGETYLVSLAGEEFLLQWLTVNSLSSVAGNFATHFKSVQYEVNGKKKTSKVFLSQGDTLSLFKSVSDAKTLKDIVDVLNEFVTVQSSLNSLSADFSKKYKSAQIVDATDNLVCVKFNSVKYRIAVLYGVMKIVDKFINNVLGTLIRVHDKMVKPSTKSSGGKTVEYIAIPQEFVEEVEKVRSNVSYNIHDMRIKIGDIPSAIGDNGLIKLNVDVDKVPFGNDTVDKVVSGNFSLGLINAQREYVWKTEQQTQLFVSVLKGMPIPPVIGLYEGEFNGEPLIKIIDGQQRLNTLCKILLNLPLTGSFNWLTLDSIKDATGSIVFSALPVSLQEHFKEQTIPLMLLDTTRMNEAQIKLFQEQLFSALNSGTPVTATETTTAKEILPVEMAMWLDILADTYPEIKFASGVGTDVRNKAIITAILPNLYAGKEGAYQQFLQAELHGHYLYDDVILQALQEDKQFDNISETVRKRHDMLVHLLDFVKANRLEKAFMQTSNKVKTDKDGNTTTTVGWKFLPLPANAIITLLLHLGVNLNPDGISDDEFKSTQDVVKIILTRIIHEFTTINKTEKFSLVERFNGELPSGNSVHEDCQMINDFMGFELENPEPSQILQSLEYVVNKNANRTVWDLRSSTNTHAYHVARLAIAVWCIVDEMYKEPL